MKFTTSEKEKLIEYVVKNLMISCNLTLEESRNIVYNSILPKKIETSPTFIAHCSMSQLIDLVKKDMNLISV